MSQLMPQTFPLEILMYIVNRLRIQDKAKLSMVNREWHDYIAANDWVWLKLDTGIMSFDNDLEAFDATSVILPYLSKTNYGTHQLSIQHNLIKCNWVKLGLQRCSELRELRLARVSGGLGRMWNEDYCLPVLRKLELKGDFDVSVPVRFLDNCPRLECAYFTFNKQAKSRIISAGTISKVLKTLKISSAADLYATYPVGMIEGASSLEDLEVRGYQSSITTNFRSLANLKRLCIPMYEHLPNLQMPLSLEELDLHLEDMMPSMTITSMPNLKALTVSYSGTFGTDNLIHSTKKLLCSTGDRLTKLVLMDGCEERLVDELEAGFFYALGDTGKVRNVKIFAIDFRSSIRNPTLEAIALVFPKMEKCVLYGNFSEVTEDHLHAFVEGLPNLKGLNTLWPKFGGSREEWPRRKDDMDRWLLNRGIAIHSPPGSEDADLGVIDESDNVEFVPFFNGSGSASVSDSGSEGY